MDLTNFITQLKDGFQKTTRFTCHLFLPQTLTQAIFNPSLITNIIDVLFPVVGEQLDDAFAMPTITNWLAQGLLCEATTLPTRSAQLANMSQYGFTEHFPFHAEFIHQECTFLTPHVKQDNPVPRMFNYWLNFIQNGLTGAESGFDFRFPSDYYATMYLVQYDNETNPSSQYRFERVYPHQVNGQTQSLNWGHEDFTRTNVTFAYSYYVLEPFTAPPLINLNINL